MNVDDRTAVREWIAGQLAVDPELLTVNAIAAGGHVEVVLDASLFPPSPRDLILVVPPAAVHAALAAWDGASNG